MDDQIDPREVLAEMSDRGRVEWDLAVERVISKRLRARVAELENAAQAGPRRADSAASAADTGDA